MSGYRRIAGFPLPDLKAEGLDWGVSSEGMLLKCFEQQGSADVSLAHSKTCGVNCSNNHNT